MTGALVVLIVVFGLVWLAVVGIGMIVPTLGRPPRSGRQSAPVAGSAADGDGAEGGASS